MSGPAAVVRQRRFGKQRGLLGDQVGDEGGNLLRRRDAVDRVEARDVRGALGGSAPSPRNSGASTPGRSDDVDPDPLLRELKCRLGRTNRGVLDADVRTDSAHADDAELSDVVDDAASPAGHIAGISNLSE